MGDLIQNKEKKFGKKANEKKTIRKGIQIKFRMNYVRSMVFGLICFLTV